MQFCFDDQYIDQLWLINNFNILQLCQMSARKGVLFHCHLRRCDCIVRRMITSINSTVVVVECEIYVSQKLLYAQCGVHNANNADQGNLACD